MRTAVFLPTSYRAIRAGMTDQRGYPSPAWERQGAGGQAGGPSGPSWPESPTERTKTIIPGNATSRPTAASETHVGCHEDRVTDAPCHKKTPINVMAAPASITTKPALASPINAHPVERSQRHNVIEGAGAGNASRCAWSRQASRSVRISSSIAFRSASRCRAVRALASASQTASSGAAARCVASVVHRCSATGGKTRWSSTGSTCHCPSSSRVPLMRPLLTARDACTAANGPLLDDLVGAHENYFRDGDTQCFRRPEVHDQLEPRWAFDREFGRLGTA